MTDYDALEKRLRDKTRLRKHFGLTGIVLHEEALTDEAAAAIRDLRAERDALRELLQMLYDEQMDYIKINKLCGAENNHVMVAARAALAAHERKP